MVKKCGVLRGLCGVYFQETPQRKTLRSNRLKHLRYIAGFYLYTYARAHARMCRSRQINPAIPRNAPIFLPYKDLSCGVCPNQTPQRPRRNPATYWAPSLAA